MIYLDLLRRSPRFRYLWMAQVVSLTGDWFNTIAVIILVTRYTDSGAAVGGLLVARSLPPFLFGPIAGVVADRFDRKTILIISNVLRIFVVLGYLLVGSSSLVWLIYVLSIAQFAISAFFEPAYAAILPSLIKREDLLTANTLSSITWSAMLALGAMLGGATTAVVGVSIALVIDAITFGVAALLLALIPVDPSQVAPTPSGNNGWLDFLDGLRYVQGNPQIGLAALVKGLSHIGSVDFMVTLYAERVFTLGQDGAVTLGLLYASTGLGSVLGPLVGSYLGQQTQRWLYRAITAGFILLPISWFLYSTAPNLPILLGAAFLRGLAGSVNWTYSSVLLQIKTPDRFLGRVFGLDFTIFTLAFSASVFLSGVIFDQFDLTRKLMLKMPA